MNRPGCVLILLLLPFLANADKGKAVWQGADRPVYVVTKNDYGEDFGGTTPRFGDLIAIEIFNPKAHAGDDESAYRPGERLPVFVAGDKVGDVTVKKIAPFQCDSSAALVSADQGFHLQKDAIALASNAQSIRPHANYQRHPDLRERKYAVQLAMNEFQKHDVPAEMASDIKIDQLVVTKIDDSNSLFLIGSLFLRTKSALHKVFLIGKIGASSATAELVQYNKSIDLTEGTDGEDYVFVDQLDLDGDGVDEVVVELRGYEEEEFDIYKRYSGSWREVHDGGEGGC
ncbi:MAG: hypothetical protein WBE86_13240 [Candidatus Acidiferrales bacterium]